MYLNCVDMTPKAREYATSHKLCEGTKSKPRSVTPNQVAEASCGNSYLWMSNHGGGQTGFSIGASTYDWSMNGVVYTVSWQNQSAGYYNSYSDHPIFQDSMGWEGYRQVGTGGGQILGSLSGHAELWWGGTCDFAYPSDSVYTTN